ncbi:hypothetical protein EBA01_18355 [Xanthomonas oryzae pv. oryzae]|nr:hypothetical protein C0L89_18360 [Xanthomonas oryzae pv. oryzae]QBI13570.1 hypothetical protein EYR02_18575 [Xanthomonas oryzae pv. oryzae]QBN29592.1 hypothetical protein EBA01_18355 [Xanthomonas oryzae pv. oryzae]QBN33252.1 hypothetical protein EBA02_18545 [Xanthomonas oryzae pv. oryzae]QBN36837.1 hypothetical protein EBA03_18305 [Xanthomonas oryzae pv. oryzae]
MEELRAKAQYQLAVHPFGVPGTAAQEIVNRFLQGRTCSVSRDGGRARALQPRHRSAAVQ